MRAAIATGDARTELKRLPSGVAQTCVSSPPYWGLRDYGCEGQIGLEETPAAYVARLVEVFAEVRRVLREDGTLWLNLGDSYVNARGRSGGEDSKTPARRLRTDRPQDSAVEGLKRKDLVGIPWRVAFALQAAGWTLRQDIVWHKPNPMPAPVTDRCVSAHEYLFLLSKSPRYYFDHVAIQEPATGRDAGNGFNRPERISLGGRGNPEKFTGVAMRNKRSVWSVSTRPFKEAHFATFPPPTDYALHPRGLTSGGRRD
jgi:site-specific DNA-methyltransferase (adenine-specific)